jgi:hypothetical protein
MFSDTVYYRKQETFKIAPVKAGRPWEHGNSPVRWQWYRPGRQMPRAAPAAILKQAFTRTYQSAAFSKEQIFVVCEKHGVWLVNERRL